LAIKGTASYGYDPAGQLTQAGTATFAYDPNGNRADAGFVLTADNLIMSDGVYTYTYDAERNRVGRKKLDGSDAWTYSYDHNNQLVAATHQATAGGAVDAAVTYSYGSSGFLVGVFS
jgi:uncharacterized protein RhaS with RHS repeats